MGVRISTPEPIKGSETCAVATNFSTYTDSEAGSTPAADQTPAKTLEIQLDSFGASYSPLTPLSAAGDAAATVRKTVIDSNKKTPRFAKRQ